MVADLKTGLLPAGIGVGFTLDITGAGIADQLSGQHVAGKLGFYQLVLLIPVHNMLYFDSRRRTEETDHNHPAALISGSSQHTGKFCGFSVKSLEA